MKKSFISLLRKALLLPPIVVIVFMVTGWSSLVYLSWKKEVAEAAEKRLEERKNFIKERAFFASSFIEYQRKATLGRVKADLESRLENSYRLMDSLYDLAVSMGKEGAETMIMKSLDEMAFAQSWGFVMNESGGLIEYPGRLMPSLPCHKDKIPTDYLVKNMKKDIDKGAQVSFIVVKSGDKNSRIYCLRRFEPLGWIIGISASYDEMEKETMKIVSGWFSLFESIGPQGFIFVVDDHGRVILNSGLPQITGMNIKEASLGSVTDKSIKDIAEKKGGFTEISWGDRKDRPAENSQAYLKSMVTGFSVPEWGWIAGVGFFTDDLEKAYALKKEHGRHELLMGLRFLLFILPVFLGCGFYMYKRIALKLEKNFMGFHDFFTSAQETGKKISADEMDFTEFESMAEAANSMLDARHDSEGKLRQSETNFSFFFRAIDDGIIVVDEKLQALSMNPAAYRLIGADSETAASFSDIASLFDSETDIKIRAFINAPAERSIALGQGHILTGGGLRKNVENFILQGLWNESKAFFILSRDISTLVASEEKFSRIFKESPVMMAVSTVDEGRFVDINNTALEYLEYPKDHFIGRASMETGIFADPSWRSKTWPLLIREGKIRNEEVDLVTKSGRILHCLVSLDMIFFSGNKYILTVANNITDRKKAERALLAAKEEALESKAKLEETLRDLELFNKFMMDREERILSLKEEVNELLNESGKDNRYSLDGFDRV